MRSPLFPFTLCLSVVALQTQPTAVRQSASKCSPLVLSAFRAVVAERQGLRIWVDDRAALQTGSAALALRKVMRFSCHWRRGAAGGTFLGSQIYRCPERGNGEVAKPPHGAHLQA